MQPLGRDHSVEGRVGAAVIAQPLDRVIRTRAECARVPSSGPPARRARQGPAVQVHHPTNAPEVVTRPKGPLDQGPHPARAIRAAGANDRADLGGYLEVLRADILRGRPALSR